MNSFNNFKKKIYDYNLINIILKNQQKKHLKNKNITFITPNCIGGILFHDLDLQFRSPTINTMIDQKDFTKFILNLDEYLSKELIFFEKPGFNCPCAFLGDITIHFTHYESREQALDKWNKRVKRIDKHNIFVFAQEKDGLTKEEIESLSKAKVKGLVVFTAHDYNDIPYAVYLSKYEKKGEVGNILKRNIFTGEREYNKYFDFIEWFNKANGKNYDCEKFIKK